MVINGSWGNYTITLSDKPNCLTVSLETGRDTQVFSFDLEGRLWTALLDNISYRRGLDGKIVAKWQPAANSRERRWLTGESAHQVVAQGCLLADTIWQAQLTGDLKLDQDMPERVIAILDAARHFDQKRSEADVQHYHQVYRPVGILPPDQYMAVVLQATEGCSFNTCTFCNFYRDRPFRIKPPDDFKEHALKVRDFLGKGLSLRRTIFLGDANALVTPMPRLLPIFDTVHHVFDVEKMGGIFAFLDGFSGEKKSVADYQLLREKGLKRVYVGMESGNADLLKFLKKPGKPEDVIHAVQTMKRAGVPVGVIVLLGAGGSQYATAHVQDTISALNTMDLDMDDIVYFSELIESEGMQYVRDAYQANLRPISSDDRISQGDEIERGLIFSEERGEPHISRYDIREFVY